MCPPPPHNSEHLTHPKYRPDIDGLRAIAILSVVGFHAFSFWVKGGFIGVDVFFVISGYLISTIMIGSLERNSFSFTEFYARRINRIFPALLLVMIASFAYGWFALPASEYKQLGKHIAGGAGFVSNFLLWNESGYFDNVAETKPLLHLWSLGVEEQFYIIWPLILWFAWKLRLNLMATTIVVGTISFAINIGNVQSDAVAAFYSPQTRFWELMAGSVLAYMMQHKQNSFPPYMHKLDIWMGKIVYAQSPETDWNSLRNIQSFSGAALIAIGVIAITKESFPGWWAVLPTLGAVLIISAGAQAWLNRVVLSNRVLVWFGLVSYPLYLWHWPLLSFVRIIEYETPSMNIRIAVVLISVVLAWLTYILIEKPLRFLKYGNTKAITLFVFMIIVGYVGYNSYIRDGLAFRKIAKTETKNPFIIELSSIKGTWAFFDANFYYRYGICHMVPIVDKRLQMTNCIDSNRPLIFIWGDSYAASLYPGLFKLKTLSKNAFGIAQFTNGNAPPFFDANKKTDDVNNLHQNLLDVNNEKLRIVAEIKPTLIILCWMLNGLNGVDMNQSVVEINSTIKKISAASANTKIMVLGPFPHWNGDLKDVIIKYASEHHDHLPPQYTNYGLQDSPKKWDLYFKDEFKKLDVSYISSQDFLCNTEGCLTRTGDYPKDLTAVDWGHLTPKGSEFLINKIGDRLFHELGIHP